MPIISKSQDQKEDQIVDMARQIALEYESKNQKMILESQKKNQEMLDENSRRLELKIKESSRRRKNAKMTAVCSAMTMAVAIGCFFLYDKQLGLLISTIAIFASSVLDLIDD